MTDKSTPTFFAPLERTTIGHVSVGTACSAPGGMFNSQATARATAEAGFWMPAVRNNSPPRP